MDKLLNFGQRARAGWDSVSSGSASTSGGDYKGQSRPLTRELVGEPMQASLVILGKPLDETIMKKYLPRTGLRSHELFHWMAWFAFNCDDEQFEFRMAELDVVQDAADGTKKIKGKFTKMSDEGVRDLLETHGWAVVEKKETDFPQLSPQAVFEQTERNSLNGRDYDPLNRNCQHWVKELCQSLGYTVTSEDLGEKGGWVHVAQCAVVEAKLKMDEKTGKIDGPGEKKCGVKL